MLREMLSSFLTYMGLLVMLSLIWLIHSYLYMWWNCWLNLNFEQITLPGPTQVSHHIMPTRQFSHSDVSWHEEQLTQQYLKVSQETMQPGWKRSGTHVIHDQQLAKRSQENLCKKKVQALKTEAQLSHIKQQVDSKKKVEKVHNVRSQLREWKVKKDYKMLKHRWHYIEKSIKESLSGMSETVQNGLATLSKLKPEMLKRGLKKELESLSSISVKTDEKRLNRVNDWVKATRTCKHCKPLLKWLSLTFYIDFKSVERGCDDGCLAEDWLVTH